MDGGLSEDILTSSCLLLFSTTAFSFFFAWKEGLESFKSRRGFSQRAKFLFCLLKGVWDRLSKFYCFFSRFFKAIFPLKKY